MNSRRFLLRATDLYCGAADIHLDIIRYQTFAFSTVLMQHMGTLESHPGLRLRHIRNHAGWRPGVEMRSHRTGRRPERTRIARHDLQKRDSSGSPFNEDRVCQ